MPLLQIRDVPAEVRDVLKRRAKTEGLSLNAYLVRLLTTEASHPTMAEVLDRVAARSERATASSVEALREAREERDAHLAAAWQRH
jgi:antitoxin FitA